jgi:hypothetical protein
MGRPSKNAADHTQHTHLIAMIKLKLILQEEGES